MVMPEHSEVEMIELIQLCMPYSIRLDDMGRERCVNPMQFRHGSSRKTAHSGRNCR